MANRIISFGTTENLLDSNALSSIPTLDSYDIYKDVNMTSIYSEYAEPTLKNEYINEDTEIKKIYSLVDAKQYKTAAKYLIEDCTTNTKNELKNYVSSYNDRYDDAYYKYAFEEWKIAEDDKLQNNYNIDLSIWNDMSRWSVDKCLNVKAIFNSLRNIFTWHQGERILLPEFGSRLHMLLYEGITPITEEAIIAEIRSCISEWEPRIQITSIVNASTIDDTEDNVIHIEIMFTIPALGNEQYSYDFSYTRNS